MWGMGFKKKIFFFGNICFGEFFEIENFGGRGRVLGKQIAALETPLNCASTKAKNDVKFQNYQNLANLVDLTRRVKIDWFQVLMVIQ
jgi:hypothetical protein